MTSQETVMFLAAVLSLDPHSNYSDAAHWVTKAREVYVETWRQFYLHSDKDQLKVKDFVKLKKTV